MVKEVDPQSRGAWFQGESRRRAFIKVRTGGDGRYRVAGLAEGDYMIHALSRAYVSPGDSPAFEVFKSVTLDEGESRDDVNIALVRGGVITGRVVDNEGRPIVATFLRLAPVDEKGRPNGRFDLNDDLMMRTDDRGVYRIYGLPAGRYIISAGGEWSYSHTKRKYSETFHPDATDRTQAKIIAVKEGAEVVDIDIRLGAGRNTYEATGRVVDAETGQPLPQAAVICWEAPDKKRETRHGREGVTNSEGAFRVGELPSGRYELYMRNKSGMFDPASASMANSEYYSEKTVFEVSDSDVSGLEVKAIRGSTISGIVALESANDPAVQAKLRQMEVEAHIAPNRGLDSHIFVGGINSKIGADGGFRLTGAPPGMAKFHLRSAQGEALSIKRIERDGIEIRSAFEIRRGEHIAGVRVIVAHANGSIRGQVEIAGGKAPEGWEFHIRANPIRTEAGGEPHPAFDSNYGRATADGKGRFVIERLAPGEYELTLNAMIKVGQNEWGSAPGTSGVRQRVTVSNGAETTVKFTIDPARR